MRTHGTGRHPPTCGASREPGADGTVWAGSAPEARRAPVMDATGMLRGIAAGPDLQSVPVVEMSSMPEATVAARATSRFLRKRFRIAKVACLVDQLIARS